ncbi:hypothetical protein Pfo_027079 [Paulownia fortunei]|nr:hypothetical protein Pfo_027079 [Paulownia fortunei]
MIVHTELANEKGSLCSLWIHVYTSCDVELRILQCRLKANSQALMLQAKLLSLHKKLTPIAELASLKSQEMKLHGASCITSSAVQDSEGAPQPT